MEKEFVIINKIYSNDDKEIFKVKNINNNEIYALKVIKVKALRENFIKIMNNYLNECDLLSGLDNEYIIKIKNYWISNTHFNNKPKKTSSKYQISYLYIQMDFYEKTLQNFINDLNDNFFRNNKKMNNLRLITIMSKLVEGLEYLHKNNIIHRDLKPSNILISNYDNSDEINIKICDFGISKKLDNIKNKYTELYEFDDFKTLLYSSPEQKNSNFYNFSTDIFSLGLIFFQFFHLMKTNQERIITMTKIKSGKFDTIKLDQTQKLIFNFIKGMLHIDFKARTTLSELQNQLILLRIGVLSQLLITINVKQIIKITGTSCRSINISRIERKVIYMKDLKAY